MLHSTKSQHFSTFAFDSKCRTKIMLSHFLRVGFAVHVKGQWSRTVGKNDRVRFFTKPQHVFAERRRRRQRKRRLTCKKREKLLSSVCVLAFLFPSMCVHPRESKHRFIHVLCGVGQKYSNAAATARSLPDVIHFFSKQHTP
jgi:hypothetical protein